MNYEINEGTMAIISIGNGKCRILEDKNEYLVEKSSFDLIDYSCKYFGSSFEGRKEGARSILNLSYKVPIVIENTRNLIFFPTSAPTSPDCSWISLKDVDFVVEREYNSSKIIFKNGEEVEVPVSRRIIDNQILRASRLDLIMRNRKQVHNLERNSYL